MLLSNSLTFTPADDAYIDSNVPTANYGTDTELQVDDSPTFKHFLLKFDVTGVNGQTVTNAKLCLYNKDGAQAEISIMLVTIPRRKTCPELVEGNSYVDERARGAFANDLES